MFSKRRKRGRTSIPKDFVEMGELEKYLRR